MQTQLPQAFRTTPEGREAEAILRACVHCGFCTATCPTYRLLGDERDSPRGRIYLIKQLLEGAPVSRITQTHLDRCLTCRSCETTCPSGVRYARLLEIGRLEVERRVRRPPHQVLARWAVRRVVPRPRRLRRFLGLARLARPLLPGGLRRQLPQRNEPPPDWPEPCHARRMLILEGCAQAVLTPQVNAALARILDALGIALVRVAGAGCCGALSQHLAAADEAHAWMRRNIDAWWPEIEAGAEAVVVSASGCGVTVKEYGEQLAGDEAYAERASRVAELARDPVEILEKEPLETIAWRPTAEPLVFHPPCTLQHGQRLAGRVEALLDRLGFDRRPVADRHLCCGAAGSHAVLQPRLANRLRAERLAALQASAPAQIATANVGCQHHLAAAAGVPVRHWLEVLAEALPHDS